MLDLVDLAGFANRYPHELSGGEAQRVALARALAPAPAAVLLDEPFSNLDQNLRSSLRLQLREILRAADTAAVFVTHDREEALSLADRIAVMRAGTVEQVGAPIEIYHHPANRFVASFVGNANVLHGDRSRHGAETPMGALSITGSGADAGPGEPLDILLRPEQISLQTPHDAPPQHCGQDHQQRVLRPRPASPRAAQFRSGAGSSIAQRPGLGPRRSRRDHCDRSRDRVPAPRLSSNPGIVWTSRIPSPPAERGEMPQAEGGCGADSPASPCLAKRGSPPLSLRDISPRFAGGERISEGALRMGGVRSVEMRSDGCFAGGGEVREVR